MKKILLFGAGKSASVLITYLLQQAEQENWEVWIVDVDLELVRQKTGRSPYGHALAIDITKPGAVAPYIQQSDLVISLLPPHLHLPIAADCVLYKKPFLTASYIDADIRALQPAIEDSGVLFLCEMGLDPGIDHMSAKQLIDRIERDGGNIISFLSHCGGLVAPESDDNPWHYKISWNPRNVVMAGKSGAIFKENGIIKELEYEEVFMQDRELLIPGYGAISWYPNRNSLPYIDTYHLPGCQTFIRTTLRHPDFISGWKNMIELKLTDENKAYLTDGTTLMQFYKEHMEKNGFSGWVQHKLQHQLTYTNTLLENLVTLIDAEEAALIAGNEQITDLLMVTKEGSLQDVNVELVKTGLASEVADKMRDTNISLKQLFYLGMDDKETIINKGFCSAADVLQFALEKKLSLKPTDKDMVIMRHEITYEKDGKRFISYSTLLVKGEDNVHTAMAKTVGLPLGIAAKFILNNTIQLTGLHIPTHPEIYEPVLKELATHVINFQEETHSIS